MVATGFHVSPDRVLARALERIGDRWTLLIVGDLLFGPLRFTDLEWGFNEITPTRLTARLRELESERFAPGRRRLPTDDVSLEGPPAELRRFTKGFRVGLAA